MMIIVSSLQSRQSRVFTAWPVIFSQLPVSSASSPREQLTYFTLHHPAKTKAPQPVNEWEHPHSHIHRPANLLNPINYYLTFLPSYCYSQVVLNNVAPHTISAEHCALQTLHTLTLPTIFHRFFLFNINKPHSTLNKYKTGQSLNSL